MAGDALVLENERLHQRMNLFFDKFEAALRQTLRGLPGEPQTGTEPGPAGAGSQPDAVRAQALAAVLTAYCMGQLQRYVRSGFRKMPSEQWSVRLQCLLVA